MIILNIALMVMDGQSVTNDDHIICNMNPIWIDKIHSHHMTDVHILPDVSSTEPPDSRTDELLIQRLK